MWQRYNQTTHIFEKSVDNGANWSPLALSGSIITEGSIPNVAYKNQANTFTQTNTIDTSALSGTKKGIIITDTAAPTLMLTESGAPANARKWRMYGYAQDLHFDGLNDAENTATARISFTRNGFINIAGGFIERSRTTALGDWINVPFVASNFFGNGGMTWTPTTGQVGTNRYALVGKTLFWNFSCNGSTIGGTPGPGVGLVIPGGFVAAAPNSGIVGREQNSGWRFNCIATNPGSNSISVSHIDFSNYVVPETIFYLYFSISFEIQ